MEIKKGRHILLFFLLTLLLLLGVSGVCGGFALIADPSGKMLELDSSYIHSTFFKNYLLPGIILLIFNGIFPLFIFYSLLRQPKWTWPERINIYKEQYWQWTLALYSGIILVIWIFIQMLLLGYLGVIQSIFGLLGTCMIILTLTPVVKDHYSKPPEYL
jgi:hypothetical protein